jgi:hypothetical protein
MIKTLIPRAIAAAIASICLAAVPAAASAVDVVAGPDNAVMDVVTSDNGTSYVTGGFSAFGWYDTKGIAVADATTGQIDSTFPQVRGGSVRVTTPDGTGGWYLGGNFTTVGGVARAGLAHVLADGSVDAAWDPVATFYGGPADILSIVPVGNTVFIAGGMDHVGADARWGIAALDANGDATSWDAQIPNGLVWSVVPIGSTVYIGGEFATVQGATRRRVAALDASTAVLDPWNPSVGPYGTVQAMTPSADGTVLYMVGNFDCVGVANTDFDCGDAGEVTRNGAAAVTTDSAATLQAWNPNLTANEARTLLRVGNTVYIGGDITAVGGTPRAQVAAVSATGSGALLPWNPEITATTVYGLAASTDGQRIYIAGVSAVHGVPVTEVGAVDATTAARLDWTPLFGYAAIRAVATQGSSVMMGGDLGPTGGIRRSGIAAVDATGALTNWAPAVDGWINDVLLLGDTLYIAGEFTTVNGQSRAGLAAISTDGTVTGWDPNVGAPSDPGRSFDTLAASPDGQTIYVGGGFTRMGAVSGLANLAAVRADGSVSGNWKPQITSSGGGPSGGPVKTIAPTGDRVYVGGFFDQVGADARNNVAALDAATGAAISTWAPSVDNLVNTLAVTTDGSIAYMGGTFTNVNNTPRTRLAAVGQNGTLLPWAPNPGASVKTIAVNDAGTHVVARGPLTFFGTPFVSDFAPDGTLNWSMDVNDASLVWSTGFWCDGTRLTVGGAFASWNGQTARGVATLALDGTPMANPLATCSSVPPAPGTGGGSTPTTPTDGTGASAPQPTTTPAAQPGRLRFSGRPRTQSRSIAVRVVAPGPGRLTVRGTWTTGEMATRTGCTGTVTVRAAGTATVPCRLNADVLTARQRRSVMMRLNAEFTGTSGGTAVGATALRLNRAALRLAVTG